MKATETTGYRVKVRQGQSSWGYLSNSSFAGWNPAYDSTPCEYASPEEAERSTLQYIRQQKGAKVEYVILKRTIREEPIQ